MNKRNTNKHKTKKNKNDKLHENRNLYTDLGSPNPDDDSSCHFPNPAAIRISFLSFPSKILTT